MADTGGPGWDLIGFQAQCQVCEFASILHLEHHEAQVDADLHFKFYYHPMVIRTCICPDDIRAAG